jgi:hypothetical protein
MPARYLGLQGFVIANSEMINESWATSLGSVYVGACRAD